MDWNPDPMSCVRKLSIVVQLSDPNTYTGCDLILKNGNANYYFNRTRGNAIFFPSFYLHKVTPLTSGTRYSLVIWIEGDSFQ
jgi:PKHD-type hydroxylase